MFWDNTHSDYSGDNRNNYHTNVFGMDRPLQITCIRLANYSGGMSETTPMQMAVTYFFLRGDAFLTLIGHQNQSLEFHKTLL